MKKIISIGVALALLTMVVVPGAAAAYTPPATYSKVPFAIIQAAFELGASLVPAIEAAIGEELPIPLDTMLPDIGEFAGGPLAWTVDMMAWGLSLGGEVYVLLDDAFGIGYPVIGDVLDTVACGLMMCWSATNCTGVFDPCP